MKKISYIFLLSLLLFSCFDNSKMNDTSLIIGKTNDSITKIVNVKQQNSVDASLHNIDSLWNKIIKINGCLTNGVYAENGKFRSEGCIIDEKQEWEVFLNIDKTELTHFLISKLQSKDSTYSHTCPFFLATEGELAIYGLQRVHKINWFDFKEFSEFKNKEVTSAVDNHQKWIQDILSDTKQRYLLENLWL